MITTVRLVALRRSRPNEFVAKMAAVGEDPEADPAQFAGARIRERFGRNERYGRLLRNEDILPSFANQLSGQPARAVARNQDQGDEGTFTVGPDGKFLDNHGMDFRPRMLQEVFTPEALVRGIGTYFVQTYYHDNRAIARFRVVRIFTCDRGGRCQLTVRKRQLG